MLRKEKPEKKRTPRKVSFPEAVIILILIVIIMIWGALLAGIPTGVSLMFSTILVAVYGGILGFTWSELMNNVLNVVKKTIEPLLFLVLIGFVSAAWLASGSVAYLIYYGLELLNPTIFLLTTFLLTFITALPTSSWAAVPSVGIAMVGVSMGLGVPLPLTAGAIVSGAWCAESLSPLSDTLLLSSATTGQSLMKLLGQMFSTEGVACVAGGIIYLVIGFKFNSGGTYDTSLVSQITKGIAENFNLSIWLLIPILVIIVLCILKFPMFPVFTVGIILGMAEAVIFQGVSLKDISGIVWNGYVSDTGIEILDTLMSGGGVMSLASLIIVLLIALSFAGIVEKIGMLDALIDKMLKFIINPFLLTLFSMITTIVTVFLTASVYVSTILNGRMYLPAYKKMGLHPVVLSRVLQNGASPCGALCPWSAGALLVVAATGVQTFDYLPYCFVPLIGIVLAVLWPALGIFNPKLEESEGNDDKMQENTP